MFEHIVDTMIYFFLFHPKPILNQISAHITEEAPGEKQLTENEPKIRILCTIEEKSHSVIVPSSQTPS